MNRELHQIRVFLWRAVLGEDILVGNPHSNLNCRPEGSRFEPRICRLPKGIPGWDTFPHVSIKKQVPLRLVKDLLVKRIKSSNHGSLSYVVYDPGHRITTAVTRFSSVGFCHAPAAGTSGVSPCPTHARKPRWPPLRRNMHSEIETWFVFFSCVFVVLQETVKGCTNL